MRLRCNRCGKLNRQATTCDESACRYDEYYKTYNSFFRGSRVGPIQYRIALSGGPDAGKTYYLLSLLSKLLTPSSAVRELLSMLGIKSFDIVDPVSLEYYKDLELDCEQDGLEATLPTEAKVADCISVVITFFQPNKRPCELIFYDTSGEVYKTEIVGKRRYEDFIEVTGMGTLYFVDPLEDSMLNGLLDSPKTWECLDLDIVTHLHRIQQIQNNGRAFAEAPVAICVSKFDLLEHFIPSELPAYIYSSDHSFDKKQINSASKALETFLDQKKSKTIDVKNIKSSFSNYSFFATAPTGIDIPHPRMNDLNPKGIVNPLLWMLLQLRIIK